MTATLTKQLSLFPYLEHQHSERPAGFIPIYEPDLSGREEKYVLDAVRSGWISYLGEYCDRFERDFAKFCGTRYAIATCNGTVALHLALATLDIGPGDEVILPTLTFVATANAIKYTGATPIFADVDPITWNIDPDDVARLITPHTKAIMPVHIYGHPADMAQINAIAQEYDLYMVEDAAEAHGAEINGERTGSFGHIAAFSLMANKIITTGEGGMVTTNDEAIMKRARYLRDHAMNPERRYWHDEVGFNYRMTNLQAAVGVAQLERAEQFIARKRRIAEIYDDYLTGLPGLTTPAELPGYTNVYWMYSVLLDDGFALTRDELVPALRKQGIDSRPFFHPLDTMPMYQSDNPRPVALDLSRRGINLPSAPTLADEQVVYICNTLRELSR